MQAGEDYVNFEVDAKLIEEGKKIVPLQNSLHGKKQTALDNLLSQMSNVGRSRVNLLWDLARNDLPGCRT